MTLTASDLSHGFDGEPVLSDVSLSVEPGDVVTIVGPSGTGKTTLLRLLGMFHPPDSGTIEWQNEDVWRLSEDDRLEVRRRVSMVFQEPSLFNAPVAQNVTYGLRVRQSWSKRVRASLARTLGGRSVPDGIGSNVTNALETVGLVDKIDQNALSLSGGEAQRVAFARALATDPEILLLDEPSSNLDPRNTAVIEEAIADARRRGLGVVVATHDMHQAERISDRVGVLLDGTVIETGPPEQVFDSPDDDRTRKFVAGELMY
ncbi:tungstate transport system ATP-binding protein [Haladaptatus litoreus]|uniref:Tungstate transport system ATP-binding protein n=1 Tax=Haladaptatus litoreus TaxID=553468 RepID=A0A1N6WB31_9EURY|nr:phosphate ABC transporter ATP-binding protein [Haladaptatus litoreus]SIQ87222.1 tungstate transport system ATP-binding protein [Haladaptatus litoreus]